MQSLGMICVLARIDNLRCELLSRIRPNFTSMPIPISSRGDLDRGPFAKIGRASYTMPKS